MSDDMSTMKRREFIKTTALTAASLAVPLVHVSTATSTQPQEESTPQAANASDELQLGLIGVGYQGRVLLNAVRQIPHVRFRALCDIWEYARNFGQKYLERYEQEVTTYVDFREMLDKETSLDAVLIATPDFAHAEQAIACLQRGLHVYLEPMIAHTLEATRDIVQTVRRSGKLLQVGYQRRSNNRYRHLYERLIAEAKLPGVLTTIQTQWAQEAADLRGFPRRYGIDPALLQQFGYEDMSQFRNWMWYPQYCGGPFCAFVGQQLDVCNWFLNANPQAVLASGGNDFYPDRPNLDTVLSIYEYPGQQGTLRASCNMLTTTSADGMRQYERFQGTEGSLQISENTRWTRIGREMGAADWDPWVRKQFLIKPQVATVENAPEDEDVEVRVSGDVEQYQLPNLPTEPSCAPHLSNFFAAIRGEEPLRCSAEMAWPSQVAAFKALKAIGQRQTLELTPADYALD